MSDEWPHFYLVHALGKDLPAAKFRDRAGADEEARRLCLRHPNTVFVVMEPVEAYRAGTRPVEKVYLQYPIAAAPEQPPAAGPVEF